MNNTLPNSEGQQYRDFADRRILGPYQPEQVPEFPATCPPPLLDGQTLELPFYNKLSLMHEGTISYVAIHGKWIQTGAALTSAIGRAIL